MSDFEDIQRLLRLKRHERPPEDFVEDFVRQFQQRQRQELLQHSARGLLWERVTTYFEGLLEPKWRWAGAAACALVAVFLVFKPDASKSGNLVNNNQFEVRGFDVNGMQDPISDAEVERYLISRHFDGGVGTEQYGVAQGPASNVTPVPQQNVLPAGYIRQDLEVK